MKFSSLAVQNFRSIINLELNNLGQINIITGKNNCGKTSLLEAVFLVSGMSNPQLPANIHTFRNLILTSDEDFSYIFHNLDFNQQPSFRALLDGNMRELNIKPKYAGTDIAIEHTNLDISISSKNYDTTNDISKIEGLELVFKDQKLNKTFSANVSIHAGRITYNANYKEPLKCSFHNSTLNSPSLGKRIEKLLVNKQIGGVIESLREIDPSITNIQMGANEMIYVDIGLDKLLPVNIMGDGIRRILSILAAVSDMQGGVLLLDEIENGLHYSTLYTLWKALLKAVGIYHVQLFVSTHSLECIGALASFLKEETPNANKVKLFRIERNNNVHRAFDYSPEMIQIGITSNIEMR